MKVTTPAGIEVESDNISNIWECDSCGNRVVWHPADYAEMGTPICGNEDCDDEGQDMGYIMSVVDIHKPTFAEEEMMWVRSCLKYARRQSEKAEAEVARYVEQLRRVQAHVNAERARAIEETV